MQKLFLRMLVMFMVQFPGIVSPTAEKLNTPLPGQKACPLPASVLRKLAEVLCLLRLSIHIFYDINILQEITCLLIVKNIL